MFLFGGSQDRAVASKPTSNPSTSLSPPSHILHPPNTHPPSSCMWFFLLFTPDVTRSISRGFFSPRLPVPSVGILLRVLRVPNPRCGGGAAVRRSRRPCHLHHDVVCADCRHALSRSTRAPCVGGGPDAARGCRGARGPGVHPCHRALGACTRAVPWPGRAGLR